MIQQPQRRPRLAESPVQGQSDTQPLDFRPPGSMTVQGAQGPVARVERPDQGEAGPELRRPATMQPAPTAAAGQPAAATPAAAQAAPGGAPSRSAPPAPAIHAAPSGNDAPQPGAGPAMPVRQEKLVNQASQLHQQFAAQGGGAPATQPVNFAPPGIPTAPTPPVPPSTRPVIPAPQGKNPWIDTATEGIVLGGVRYPTLEAGLRASLGPNATDEVPVRQTVSEAELAREIERNNVSARSDNDRAILERTDAAARQAAGQGAGQAPVNFAPPSIPTPPPPSSRPPVAPAAPSPETPAAPAQGTGTPAAATTAPGAGTSVTPLTGQERPTAIAPTTDPRQAGLMDRLQQEAERALAQPTAWDDELAQQIVANEKRGIDRAFGDEERHLDARMADRGVFYSSIAGDGLRDLGARKAEALTRVENDVARERANSLAQGRAGAFNQASGLLGLRDAFGRADRQELRGERGYVDDRRSQARGEALEEFMLERQMGREDEQDYWDKVMSGLGWGSGSSGVNAVGNAADLYARAAGASGARMDSANANIGDLAQLAMMFYGGGK